MWKDLRQREAGSLRPHSFSRRLFSGRVAALELSNRTDLLSPHLASVNSLQIDSTEGRYLLSGASDGSVAVFDIQCPTNYEGGIIAKHRKLFSIDKRNKDAHKFAVSSAIWYPIDTGLFITASFDRFVKVWDTNETQVVMEFRMPGKVYGAAMSGISTTHALIAAGNADTLVRLCDISSGAFTHTLSGHRDGVMAVEWSNSNEFILTSGGLDGSIRFWDIRRAGCFLVLDQSNSQLGRRAPLLNNSESSVSQHATSSSKPKKGKSLSNSKNLNISSSQNRAIAHYGAVTGLRATPDGMYLLSSGKYKKKLLFLILYFRKICKKAPLFFKNSKNNPYH
ncbi:hypothetical protein LUZ60_001775 [Juncus effusus]|nr:hypothetical protein LUZ60_001775 [Juncus effusus]